MPPSIYLDNGTPVLEDSNSPVVVICMSIDAGYSVENPGITIHRDMGTVSELITDEQYLSKSFPWSGMVSVENYGVLLFQELRFSESLDVENVLRYLLKQILTLLHLSRPINISIAGKRELHQFWRAFPTEDFSEMVPCPWPREFVISDILSRMLGSTESPKLLDMPTGTEFMDLPSLKRSLGELQQKCRCPLCDRNTIHKDMRCWKEDRIQSISIFAAHVMLLSLFQDSEKLLVHSIKYGIHKPAGLVTSIRQIMQTGQPTSCPLDDVLIPALTLVNHDVSVIREENSWAISCYKGQAVYPRLFETQNPYEDGYMTLCWAPGSIYYDGQTYPRGVGSHLFPLFKIEIGGGKAHEKVRLPRNSHPNHRLVWNVTPDDGVLLIDIAMSEYNNAQRSPINLLRGLTPTFILRRCSHAANSELDEPDPLSRYAPHLININPPDMVDDPNIINVVPVDGNNGLRMYALSGYQLAEDGGPIVLRKDACMACCLKLARKIGSRVVVC